MHVDENKVYVCPWGVDHQLFRPRTHISNKYTQNRPFFLSVSCDIGRKNTISVLRAYEIFLKHHPEHDLILVWRNPPMDIVERFSKDEMKNKIHFISDIENKELGELYSSASATFFPSKYEGFGLPILESMASGTPVITCRNSSLSEVGGEAAIYVSPEDIQSMSEWMERFENESIDILSLKELSMAQASKFTWEICANKTLEVYKQCLEL